MTHLGCPAPRFSLISSILRWYSNLATMVLN
jgi:hypothetical protein